MSGDKSVKVQLDQYNNDWYDPGRGKLVRSCWYLVNALFFLNPLVPFSTLKVSLLRLFGARIGKGVVIKPGVNIKYPWKLELGNYVWIGENSWIDNLANVCIGNHVCISQGAYILTGNHNYKNPTFDLMVQSVNIKDGAWVGAKSIVCPAVTMHENAILTVGSIATKDLEKNWIYKGNPAEKFKERKIDT